jgi:hypothetical protein
MKFDQKWPHAKPGMEPVPGIVKTKGIAPCTVCGDATMWLDLDFGCFYCSEECLHVEISEYSGISRT